MISIERDASIYVGLYEVPQPLKCQHTSKGFPIEDRKLHLMTCPSFTDLLYEQAFSLVVDPGSAFVSILSVPCFSKLVRTSTPTYITCINFDK